MLVDDATTAKDDTITGNKGMGGQGVLPVPNVYNGWVQKLPAIRISVHKRGAEDPSAEPRHACPSYGSVRLQDHPGIYDIAAIREGPGVVVFNHHRALSDFSPMQSVEETDRALGRRMSLCARQAPRRQESGGMNGIIVS